MKYWQKKKYKFCLLYITKKKKKKKKKKKNLKEKILNFF